MSDKRITSNQRYNAERKAQAELMKRDLDRDKLLAQIYQESFDRMQREIDGFYMRYAGREGLTKQEAMKKASEMDVTKFADKAAKAVKEKDFSHATNEWLKVYNLKMKVSKLELLKAELTLEIQNLTAEVNEVFDKARTDEYLNEYKRQAGILGISSSGSKKRMQAILDADFYGRNFSARVWGGLGLRATLQREVFGSLNRIFTDMMGYKQEMKRLAKKYGTSEQNAKRLLKTEIARINADTQYSMLKDNGFTHMIFVAEPGACDLCGPLDKVAIPIDKVEKGVNMYPMHPNCRCSAYGHIKMEYKAGGSTLDREAPNGVWGEDETAEAKKAGQKQISGERRKLLDFSSASDYQKFEADLTQIWDEVSKGELSEVALTTKLDYAYNLGVLANIPTLSNFKPQVYISGKDLARTLAKHGTEYPLEQMLLIKDMITKPDVVADNSKHQPNSVLLYENIPGRKKSVMEGAIIPKEDGSYFIHYHKINKQKIRKLRKDGKILYEKEDF